MSRSNEPLAALRATVPVQVLTRARDCLKAAQVLHHNSLYADAAERSRHGVRLVARALLALHGAESDGRALEARLGDLTDDTTTATALALLGELGTLADTLDDGAEYEDAAGEVKRLLRQGVDLLGAVQKRASAAAASLAAEEQRQAAAAARAQANRKTITCFVPDRRRPRVTLVPFPGTGGSGRQPYFDSPLRCVMCDGYDFVTQVPRLKALRLVYRYRTPEYPLLVEEAAEAAKGVALGDPLACSVHVCPNCLYASGNTGNFYAESRFGAGSGLLQNLNSRRLAKCREALLADLPARAAIFDARLGGHEPGAVFTQPRAMQAALAAAELAAACAEVEAEYNGNALFFGGKHLLNAARLAAAIAPDEEQALLTRARDFLTRGFERSTYTAEALYLTAVLHAQAGNLNEARTRLGRLLTDRGEIPAAIRYKAWCVNLNEYIRSQR